MDWLEIVSGVTAFLCIALLLVIGFVYIMIEHPKITRRLFVCLTIISIIVFIWCRIWHQLN